MWQIVEKRARHAPTLHPAAGPTDREWMGAPICSAAEQSEEPRVQCDVPSVRALGSIEMIEHAEEEHIS